MADPRSILLALALAIWPHLACQKSTDPELVVFAASSTTDALREIGASFEASEHVRVRFSFGASNDLARQIAEGAPADVFLSADDAKLDDLRRRGRAFERTALVSNQLVVIVPLESTKTLRAPVDLATVDKLALADTGTVPIGIYAREWLTKRGAWETVQPKVVTTLDVRATLVAVETGAADAGIVYRTDALTSKKVRVVIEVAREDGPRIVYPVARLSGQNEALATKFVTHLTGKQGRDTFVKYGFLPL